ncbi:MAG: hypothetical protein ACRDX9_02065 [Acidimicrobiia bacterium]
MTTAAIAIAIAGISILLNIRLLYVIERDGRRMQRELEPSMRRLEDAYRLHGDLSADTAD